MHGSRPPEAGGRQSLDATRDCGAMPDSFLRAALAALNEAGELHETDLPLLDRGCTAVIGPEGFDKPFDENRFAATVSFCMAKARLGR